VRRGSVLFTARPQATREDHRSHMAPGNAPRFEPADIQIGEEEQDDEGSNNPTGLSALTEFYERGLITEVINPVKSGKEATVYCCRAHPSTGHDLLAAKIYRKHEARGFKNDAVYWAGVSVGKRREQLAFQKKTRIGRMVQSGRWTGREHETLSILHPTGADVPAPIAATSGALLMEFFGDENGAAPQLQHVTLRHDQARVLYQRVLDNVALWLGHHRVHADLSAFNILYWRQSVKVIDFPQAVDPRQNQNAWDLLQRDLENVHRYFSRYGIDGDPAWIAYDLRQQYTDPRYRR
jgi:RIO kinase 1